MDTLEKKNCFLEHITVERFAFVGWILIRNMKLLFILISYLAEFKPINIPGEI